MQNTSDPQDMTSVGGMWLRRVGLGIGFTALWLLFSAISVGPTLTTQQGLWSLPAGLTFALLLEYGWRALPLPILAGLLAVSFSIEPWDRWPLALTLVNAVTSLGYWGASSVVRRYPLGPHQGTYFSGVQQVTWFLVIAAASACLMTLVSFAILNAAGALSPSLTFSRLWLHGWLGDFLGIITLTPLMVTIFLPLARRIQKAQPLSLTLAAHLKGLRFTPLMGLQSLLMALLLILFFGLSLSLPASLPQWLTPLWLAVLLLLVLVWSVSARSLQGTVVTVFLVEVAITMLALLPRPVNVSVHYQMLMVAVASFGLLTGVLFHQKRTLTTVFRNLATMSNDILWACDAKGSLCQVQGSLTQVIKPASRLIGMHWRELVNSQEPSSDLDILEAAIRHHQSFQRLALSLQLPDQPAPIWTATSGLPMFDERGELLGYRGVITDISAHKTAEALLNTYQQTLEANVEAKVVERTRTLAEASVRNWRLANYDSLTKLPNRNLLFEYLRKALQQAHRQRKTLAILLVDLDGFKSVNDTYGHDAGDELLQQLGMRLHQCVRSSDTAARLGGDEFVVVLLDIEPSKAATVAQKVIACLAEPVVLTAATVAVTASVGIALYQPETPASLETMMNLLRQADAAMYAAKRAGKNNWQFAEATNTLSAETNPTLSPPSESGLE